MDLCNFFQSHDRNVSTINAPLNRLTSKEANDETKNFMDVLFSPKKLLVSEPIVDSPRKQRPFSMIGDASTATSKINGGQGVMLCYR